MHPFFSIIIPVYNRKNLIGRTLESCLVQDFRDFEIIVVDDESTDGTVEAVQNYRDPRIRVLRHEVNRGVCPARNTGMAAAKGDWIICLDSDDELLPAALRIIRQRTENIEEDIFGIRFMYAIDNGQCSPYPPLREDEWDYAGYMRWAESCMSNWHQDSLLCVRTSTRNSVCYPDSRISEAAYHFDFMRKYKIRVFPDVVAAIHDDAYNRLTRINTLQTLRNAPAQRNGYQYLLQQHGAAIERWAPALHKKIQTTYIMSLFLSGNRIEGVRRAAKMLRHDPLNIQVWVILTAGMVHRILLAWMRVMVSHRMMELNRG